MLVLENVLLRSTQSVRLHIEYLQFNSGEFAALLGPNGAGKSTLLNVLCGEIALDAGSVRFHGRDLRHWHKNTLAKNLAVLPQSSVLAFPFTAREVVALGTTPLALSHKAAAELLQRMMKMTDCWQYADVNFQSLSGGQKQRVQLARVLTQLSQAEYQPVLLLDEPTSAQDIKQQHHILAQMAGLAHGHDYAVLAVLHDMNHALQYTDRAVVLNQGVVLADDSPIVSLSLQTVEAAWAYRAEIFEPSAQRRLIY